MNPSRVLLEPTTGRSLDDIVSAIFEGLGVRDLVKPGARVVIKVNLSTPVAEMAHASNTSPELLDAVCRGLKAYTDDITVGESNGMRYKADEAVAVSKYQPVFEKHGVRWLNFSTDEWVETNRPLIKGWGLPKTILDADLFITMPVLKTHATTVFTGALKNQFGCYPQHDRILLHPNLDDVIVLINDILKPRLCIMDGIVAMEGRGPINGRPRELNMVLASHDPVALDATAMRLVGLDPTTSRHIRMAADQKLGNISADDIDIIGPFEESRVEFDPAERDLPIRLLGLISHSRFLVRHLILNPEAFYPLRSAAMMFRDVRDFFMRIAGAGS